MASVAPLLPSDPLHFLPGSFDPPYKLIHAHPSLALLSKCKSLDTFRQIHCQFIKFGLHNTQFALSKLVEFCAVSPHGDLPYAVSILNSIHNPNHVIYNMMIRGYSLSSSPSLALNCYANMLVLGLQPNSYTFPFLLKCCTRLPALDAGKQVHGQVLKFGLVDDVYAHTSLINMYAQHGVLNDAKMVFDKGGYRDAVSFTALITGYASRGCVDEARELFDAIPIRDVVSWNAMMSGYAQTGRFDEALSLFHEMMKQGKQGKQSVSPNVSTMVTILSACAHRGDMETGGVVRSWIEEHGHGSNLKLLNAMVDMYAKCGDPDTARGLFDSMREKDLVSWNVMIGGYAHTSKYKEALQVFRLLLLDNVEPNDVTLLNMIPACAHLGALDLGKWLHTYVKKCCVEFPNEALWTSLIDMYAKCGDIEAAKQIFYGMQGRSLACWNAMISGLGMHGDAAGAIDLFTEMAGEGVEPDDITFVGVLSACCHAGLVDRGRELFASMIRDYGIAPRVQHYGCVVDLLARAGLLEEAVAMVESMEVEPDGAIWGSVLGGCRLHGNVEIGEYAARALAELEPGNPGNYVALANIYAGAGRWDEVARVRTFLNDAGLRKVPGSTSIEVGGVVHEFLVSDRAHPRSEEVHRMLHEVEGLLRAADTSGETSSSSDASADREEVCEHSERLAIAFGLISTKPGTTLRIVKNLRVCGDCHAATKKISKIFKREIVARDRSRFHHFKDGECSCMDYW
ncbi:pentatricopeptide repeat-containing protein At1g08070, chloroplastic-like [Salvia miltiorrhiza]|uniref:pentatricopeptide repeat-containing protein At1g08070, chloroplastic-like n=1 Tax=Salvia miltiorrhiza TaxID=226208 RepID=UPI0025AD7228|nr:pentatricopeptide repeat-containing protein At1g08070, chloroplastic-like [Salvia miltiorrhiza]